MSDALQPGDYAKVTDIDGLAAKMPKNYGQAQPSAKAVPFAVGDTVKIVKVSSLGLIQTDRHDGYFRPHRFRKV